MYSANRPAFAPDNCIPQEAAIYDVKLAHAYVPFQKMCKYFLPLSGLKMGTIFPSLTGFYPWKKMKGPMDYE